jgi:dimethylaniline monooxygenase (N-oxide forming)
MVPLSESSSSPENRSIVIIGHIDVGNYFASAECQSMWAAAYLDQKLSLPTAEEQEKDIALFVSWCRRRYLSNGQEGNNMLFELIGYCDILLKDLGLGSHRKGWFKDLFAPAWAKDFAGLNAEFRDRYGCAQQEDEDTYGK